LPHLSSFTEHFAGTLFEHCKWGLLVIIGNEYILHGMVETVSEANLEKKKVGGE
jgi:hypothetical protein